MAIKTVNRTAGRFYFDEDVPATKYPGVTSVIDMLPKPFLQYWAAGMAAELAVDSVDYIARMADRDRDGAVKYLKGAASRYTRARASLGSKAHDMFERQIRGQRLGAIERDLIPYRDHFDAFLQAVQPRLVRAEDVAWSDTYRYAGSFDGVLELMLNEFGLPDPRGERALVMADWKTSKATYPEVALQMSGYQHADKIIAPDGSETPMPEFDGACVLHVTPERASFKPVVTDRETIFPFFLHLRETFDWVNEVSKGVIGDPIWDSGETFVTGTERRGL